MRIRVHDTFRLPDAPCACQSLSDEAQAAHDRALGRAAGIKSHALKQISDAHRRRPAGTVEVIAGMEPSNIERTAKKNETARQAYMKRIAKAYTGLA